MATPEAPPADRADPGPDRPADKPDKPDKPGKGATSAKKPSKWRRVRRIAAIVLGTPVAIVAIVLVYLHTGPGKARVRALIEKRLGERVEGKVIVGQVDYALFGEISLGDVHLQDPAGADVIVLRSASIRPIWGKLLRGEPVLASVAVDGLALNVVKDADGGSNVKRLFKPQPAPATPSEPSSKRIVVESLHIGDVDIRLAQPDGTKIEIADLGIDGKAEIVPKAKDVDVDLTNIALNLVLDKGEGALKLGLSKLTTGLSVHLTGGTGKIELHPLQGHVGVRLPGKTEERGFDIALQGFDVDVGEAGVGVSLEKLLAGVLALTSVEVKGRLKDGEMAGAPNADVVGLHVSAAQVNALLGKEVLASDVDLETHITGPDDALALDTKVKSAGLDIAIKGTVGLADPKDPQFNVSVDLSQVATDKLFAPAMGVMPVTVERAILTAKGHGREVDQAALDTTLSITNVTAKGVTIGGMRVEGRLEKGVFQVKSLEVDGLGQTVTAAGDIDIGKKQINVTLGLEGDVGHAIEHLKSAGIPIKSNLRPGLVRLTKDDLKIGVHGDLKGALAVDVSAKHLQVLGGNIAIQANASLERHDPPVNEKKVTVTGFDADITVGGIKLSRVLALRGKKLTGLDATLGGKISLTGTPAAPRGKIALALLSTRDDGGRALGAWIAGTVTPGLADVTLTVAPNPATNKKGSDAATASNEPILKVVAKLPLSTGGEKKGIDPYRKLALNVDMPPKKFADLWQYVPASVHHDTIQTLPSGEISIKADIGGTAARPEGTWEILATAQAIFGFPITQKIHFTGKIDSTSGKPNITTDLGAWIDQTKAKTLNVSAKVDLARSPVLGPADPAYHVDAAVGPISADDLPFLPPDTRALLGKATVTIEANGAKQDVTANVHVDAKGFRTPPEEGAAAPGGEGPIDLDAKIALTPKSTTLDVSALLRKEKLLALAGNIDIGGEGLFAKLKEKDRLDPGLALNLTIPKRPLASLAVIRPRLQKIPGNLVGAITIAGTVKHPTAKGDVQLVDVQRLSGESGGAGVEIDAGLDKIKADIGVGVPKGADAPLRITAEIDRPTLDTFRKEGGVLPIDAKIRAASADLKKLVPATLVDGTKVDVSGMLDWNMDAHVELEKPKIQAPKTPAAGSEPVPAATAEAPKAPAKTEMKQGSLTGTLDVRKTRVGLVGTKRAYEDITLQLTADAAGLHVKDLHAAETDFVPQGASPTLAAPVKRTLAIKADIGLDKLKPTKAELTLTTDKMLLFGPRQLGLTDAPRGTLTLEARAEADFTTPVRRAKISVKKLDLFIPDRFERAHQPEDVQAGDLVFLNDQERNPKNVQIGKLPVPDAVAEKAKGTPAKPAAPPNPNEGYDIDIEVAEGARLLQAPIELKPKGDIHIRIRTGKETERRGTLTMTGGALSLGGATHLLEKGSFSFDEQNPSGYLDLYFAKVMKPWTQRNISEASAGDAVKIHMFGPLANRTTVLSGAGSPGALWDLLAVHNTGHERYITQPDLPETMSVQFPPLDNLLILSFLSVNLPHLLFLDRFAMWADPYDGQRAYGQLRHFEAERYLANDSVRIRAETRPPGPGQSEADLSFDYLFVNAPRVLFGVGVAGGTRGGGGPGLFVEWTSRD